jgi:hypothetical protein
MENVYEFMRNLDASRSRLPAHTYQERGNQAVDHAQDNQTRFMDARARAGDFCILRDSVFRNYGSVLGSL